MKNNSFLGWIILVALLIFGLTCSNTTQTYPIFYQQDNSYERAKEIKKYVTNDMIISHWIWTSDIVGPDVKNEVMKLTMETYDITEVGFKLLMEEVSLYEKYFKQEYNERKQVYLNNARS